ncbi:hypothetical protein BaRGS_00034182 [Batillaria attramentaria]|uniref:Uncharacterized protein n=1 Tax=Batillaria attramentaria TaxID=370345 RepID=A0ABD0JIP1_9CAEN
MTVTDTSSVPKPFRVTAFKQATQSVILQVTPEQVTTAIIFYALVHICVCVQLHQCPSQEDSNVCTSYVRRCAGRNIVT